MGESQIVERWWPQRVDQAAQVAKAFGEVIADFVEQGLDLTQVLLQEVAAGVNAGRSCRQEWTETIVQIAA